MMCICVYLVDKLRGHVGVGGQRLQHGVGVGRGQHGLHEARVLGHLLQQRLHAGRVDEAGRGRRGRAAAAAALPRVGQRLPVLCALLRVRAVYLRRYLLVSFFCDSFFIEVI